MKRILLLVSLLLLCAARVQAQPAPTIVSTLQTTNTGTTSLQVGCAVGSGSCTGGIVAGPLSVGPVAISSGYVEIQSFVPVSQVNRLVNNGGTLQWGGVALALGGAVGPGTTGKLAKFTGANSVGDSICSESGTTLTCVNTVSATTLTGTLSTASQTNITGVGTITTGTWQGTKIGLAFGGTNADLSGTGGTSQFLRQNTLGGAVTVVRPAVADLSDGTNVALLNAQNVFAAAVAGAGFVQKINNSQAAGAGQFGGLEIDVDNLATSLLLREYSASASPGFTNGVGAQNNVAEVVTGAANGLAFGAIGGSGAIGFYAGGLSQRWGINSAGDFTFGASSHITDSVGTPVGNVVGIFNGATIIGTDYAFSVTNAANGSSGSVNFGHTWSTAPICTVSVQSSVAVGQIAVTTGTNGVTLNLATAISAGAGAQVFNVLCRSY